MVAGNLNHQPGCWNLADKMDSKSIVRKGVRVRVPPRAPAPAQLQDVTDGDVTNRRDVVLRNLVHG
jgi:hypothetical protein